MPDINLLLAPVAPPVTVDRRKPAHWEYLERKFIASGRKGERWRVIEHCRAEVKWGAPALNYEPLYDGLHPIWFSDRPHEIAAAKVLNAWGHLHPTEHGIHKLTNRGNGVLRAQRKAAAVDRYSESQRHDWGLRTEATRDDLIWYLAQRRKQSKAFHAAVAEYRRLRAVL